MLNLILGVDWVANQNRILSMIAEDVAQEREGRILLVPELMSHNTERRLCETAGDTASRFAEVLSFTRLARRVSDRIGCAMDDCLDDGGRIVAMAAAVQAVGSRLKAYAAVGTKPEFLVGLVDAVDEFKRCCINPADLSDASKNTQGSLAQKLEELALVYESYDGVCLHGKKDPRDQMQWLLDALRDCSYGEDHVFYVDGFPDFTRQNLAVLEHLIRVSSNVTVSLCCDDVSSPKLAFEKAGQTAAELIRIAKRLGVKVEFEYVPASNQNVTGVYSSLFQGAFSKKPNNISLFRSESVYQECLQVTQRIKKLIAGGCRYRDIGILCGNISAYRNVLTTVLQRAEIPGYLSGTDSILEMPMISTVIAAIDTAMSGFDQKDVLRYLKTPCSPLGADICDRIENYAIKWGISGSAWLHDWTYHPCELGGKWTEESTSLLRELNTSRTLAVQPLANLRDGLKKAKNIAQQVQALYQFFEDISLADTLQHMAEEYAEEDNRTAQIFDQLWEIIVSALEQLHETVGQCVWDPDVFSRLFRLLLSRYSVGTIPATLDSVTIGSVSAMRCEQVKHLFVMGALEGSFPAFSNVAGVLTDSERTELRTMGLPLTGGAIDGFQIELSEIYGAFNGTTETVTVSCPAGQPSFVYERLRKLAGCVEESETDPFSQILNQSSAAAFLVRENNHDLAEQLGLSEAYDTIRRKIDYKLGKISFDSVKKLYGKKLRLSASKVDLQRKCRFSYLLRYGLQLEERKPITVDPAEFGTYVHYVLEKTVGEVMEQGGFNAVSLEKTLEIARLHGQSYAQSRFAELGSERTNYLFKRNDQELDKVVEDLWDELHISAFLPKFMELGFDVGEAMAPIEIPGSEMDGVLRGFVDRVDIWNMDGKNYFRVVDYKTGKKSFDYCDVLNGVGLQMLLYLFALQENGQNLIGENAVPAGVQYFPARARYLSLKGMPDESSVQKARKDELKRKGLILANDDVIHAMEPLDSPYRLSYSRTKEGSLSGDVASEWDLQQLKKFVFGVLRKVVDEIASGVIDPNPSYRDERDNSCMYCPYSKVCHKESVEGFRYFKGVNANEFWESIRKECGNHD